jgi:hypothetical protein
MPSITNFDVCQGYEQGCDDVHSDEGRFYGAEFGIGALPNSPAQTLKKTSDVFVEVFDSAPILAKNLGVESPKIKQLDKNIAKERKELAAVFKRSASFPGLDLL